MNNYFVNRLSKLFSGKPENGCLRIRIGEGKVRLQIVTTISARPSGRYLSLDARQIWSWTKIHGDFNIYPEEEPNPHVLVVGMSGYGKSTLCKSLILDLCKMGKKIIVFDVHNEHADAIKSAGGKTFSALHAGINIFALDGMTVSDRINDLVSLFTQVYGLGNIQSALLASCLWYTYRKVGAPSKTATIIKSAPTISDLIDELSVFQRLSKSATERQGIQSMRSKFLPLNGPAFNENFVSLDELRNTVLSFSLAKLKNKEARAIYIIELLKRLYMSMKDNVKEQGVRHYIMIDEAQFLIGSGGMAGDLIKWLMEEGRKYGVGLIVATHSANSLDRQVVANASTFISFYSREPEEVDYVAGLLGGGHRDIMDQIRTMMMRMEQHEALVMSGRLDAPVLVKTRTAAEVRSMLVDFGSAEDENLNELRDSILFCAYKPVTKEELREKFGPKGLALSEKLVTESKLSTMLWKSDPEELWYMAYRGGLSIQHEVYVRKISDGLKQLGVPNVITVNGTNKPDIIAFARGWKAAIEYETGSKAVSDTKDMLARRSLAYKKVFVFVADEHYDRYVTGFQSGNVKILRFCELERVEAELKDAGGRRPCFRVGSVI